MKRLVVFAIAAVCVVLGTPSLLAQENVIWTNMVNVTAAPTANSLTKSGAALTWDAGASSTRAMASGDGYIEFTVTQNNIYLMAGLSSADLTTNWEDIDYVLYVCGNGWSYAYDDTGKHYLGPYTAGTTFRVEMSGGNVQYKLDGVVWHQHATSPEYPVFFDDSIYSPGGVISDAKIQGNLIDIRDIQSVFWTNKVNTSDGGTNTLTKTSAYSYWDAGASSLKAIASGDGYAEFTITQNNVYWMAGLSHTDASIKWEDIDYALYVCGNGWVYAYDDAGKHYLGPYTAGTVLRIEIFAGGVYYKMDGVVWHQHPTAPNYPLLLDSSVYTPGAVISNAIISGNLIDARDVQNVVWQNQVLVSDGGGTNTLTKSGTNSYWDAGASSVKAISSGDGYAEFTVAQNNVYWMAGLSNGDSHVYWNDIDYAIYVHPNGWVYAYDDAGKHYLGPYTAGTVLRVEIAGGNVQYKIDGVVWHQHATTPNYPLLLDTSLYTPGAIISNAIISGTLQ